MVCFRAVGKVRLATRSLGEKLEGAEELVAFLEEAARLHPDRMRLHRIGVSPEGRELLVAELSDRSSGPPEEKPGVWVDGNTHAVELAGSSACLHLIRTCLDQSGSRP